MRYVQPFVPLFFLLAATGAYASVRVIANGQARRVALHTVLAVAVLFSTLALPTWAVAFGRDTSTIRDSDVSVGAWISGNLPPGAIVAVKDLGAVTYFGNHKVVDLVGLGTNGLAEPSNGGSGSLYEALRHLPANQRPDYFAVFEPLPGPPMKPLRDIGLLRTPSLATFTVQAPTDLSGRAIVPFQEIDIYRADWSLAGSGDAQRVPGTQRDYLNVGDLASERDHAYNPEMSHVGKQPTADLTRFGNVIDSSRSIVGGEAFTAHHLIPGRAVTVTDRTDMRGSVPTMNVRVNGVDAGRWTRPSGEAPWSTSTFTIPAGLITSDTARIEIAPPVLLLNPYPYYLSYGYWFSQ